jgi:uncharacterized membrane protein
MSQDRSPISQAVSGMALLGAVLLVVSLFLDWFSASDSEDTISINGWDGLEFGDVLFVLVLLAVLGVALGSSRTPSAAPGDPRDRRASAFLALGAISLLFVILAAITTIPTVELLSSGSGTDVDVSREPGLFVAGGGALLLLLAGGMAAATQAEQRRAVEQTPPPAAPRV